MFTVYLYAVPADIAVFSGDGIPARYQADIDECRDHMAVGDRLRLDQWHYAVRTA